jgi:hypothetical protein
MANKTVELTGFRHFITRQALLMPAPEAEAYLEFTRTFREELAPVGMLEEQLSQSLADAQWRLNQIRALQSNIFATETAAFADAPVVTAHRSPRYAGALSFSLYEQRLAHQFHQNLQLLRELQSERLQREAADLDQAAQILEMEKAKSAPSQPLNYSPSDDGFVFSILQLEAHIRRRERSREAARFTQPRRAAA